MVNGVSWTWGATNDSFEMFERMTLHCQFQLLGMGYKPVSSLKEAISIKLFISNKLLKNLFKVISCLCKIIMTQAIYNIIIIKNIAASYFQFLHK